MSKLIARFGRNTVGRDFIVGDIHGSFSVLRELLQFVAFDEGSDRLFSVGDLVDRGPESSEVLDWLAKDWFHAVRGNHEQLAIDYAEGKCERGIYCINGGAWFVDSPAVIQRQIAAVFRELPLLIEIDDGETRIGIVHADPVHADWEDLKGAIDSPRTQDAAMWSRTRVGRQDESEVGSVSAVVCGHTILDQPKQLGNVIYIDTGAFHTGLLTMLEITSEGMAIHSTAGKAMAA